MRNFLVAVVVVLSACATQNMTPNTQLKAAYDTTNAYVDITKAALARGRITPDQAEKASDNAKKAKQSIDTAAAAFANCKPPCSDYVTIMQSLQPTLLEFEAELRKREKESK